MECSNQSFFNVVTAQVYNHMAVGGARRVSAGKGSSGAGSRPGTAGGLGKSSAGHSDGALAALSRQLVQAKMAEADAQRKHRCAPVAATHRQSCACCQ